MGSNSLHGVARGEVFHIKFNDPNVIIKSITDAKHPRYDARVELPVDEEMASGIRLKGILEPLLVSRDGVEGDKPILIIEAGRQRFKAWQFACESILADAKKGGTKAEDVALPTLPILIKRFSTDADATMVRLLENKHRQDDDPISDARNALDLLNQLGDTPEAREKVRVVMHVPSLPMLEQLLKLNDLHPTVQKHVTAGRLSATAASTLAKLPREEQVKAADELIAAGNTTVKATQRAVASKRGESSRANAPGVRQLNKARDGLALRRERAKASGANEARIAWLDGLDYAFALLTDGDDPDGEYLKCVEYIEAEEKKKADAKAEEKKAKQAATAAKKAEREKRKAERAAKGGKKASKKK